MVEGSSQIPREEAEIQETLTFSEFNSEYLLHLTNWVRSHGEANSRSWSLRSSRPELNYAIYIRRDSTKGDHPELNLVDVSMEHNGSYILTTLAKIERFGIKDRKDAEPDSRKSITFFNNEGGSIEVRNDGEVIAKRPTRTLINGQIQGVNGLDT